MEYSILTDLDQVVSLAAEWDALLDQTPCHRAFSCAAWYLSSCEADPPDAVCVFCARRDGVLVAVLPLMIRNGVSLFPDKMATYQDLIALPEDRQAIEGLLKFTMDSGVLGPMSTLGDYANDANLIRGLRGLLPADVLLQAADTKPCTHLPLPADFDSFLASLSFQFRKNLRRTVRKAERDGLQVRELFPHDLPPNQLPEVFLALHLERFADKSCFQRPEAEVFARLMLPRLFLQARLRVFGLFRSDTLCGIDLYLVGAASLASWNGGFRADLEPWSPGKLMLIRVLETAIGEAVPMMDFLRGLQPWKLQWTDARHVTTSVTLNWPELMPDPVAALPSAGSVAKC